MPFFLWIIFGAFDWHYKFIDDYYFQFGIGPGMQKISYSIGPENGIMNSINASGDAKVGVVFKKNISIFALANGGGYGASKNLKLLKDSGNVEPEIGSFGLGASYKIDKINMGLAVNYAMEYLNDNQSEFTNYPFDPLFRKESIAFCPNIDFRFMEGRFGKFVTASCGISMNGVILPNGDYNIGFNLIGRGGFFPNHKSK